LIFAGVPRSFFPCHIDTGGFGAISLGHVEEKWWFGIAEEDMDAFKQFMKRYEV
jgi:hypothetical protein